MFVHGGNEYWSGYNNFLPRGDFWYYNATSNAWTELPAGPAIVGASVAVFDGAFMLFGGESNRHYVHDLWYYDLTQRVWTNMQASGPQQLVHAGPLALVRNGMLVYGGDSWNTQANELWEVSILVTETSTTATSTTVTTLTETSTTATATSTSVTSTTTTAPSLLNVVIDMVLSPPRVALFALATVVGFPLAAGLACALRCHSAVSEVELPSRSTVAAMAAATSPTASLTSASPAHPTQASVA